MTSSRSFLWLALVMIVAWTGCGDAARENPLDPNAEGFRDAGSIAGQITGVYPVDGVLVGRANVAVRFVPVGAAGRPELATRTDAEGFFALGDVPAGPYAVVAEEEGFRTVSDTVTVEAGSVAETLLRLNALPIVREKSLRTVHIIRWFPEEPVFQLEVEVFAEDPDEQRDVAAAALAIPNPADPDDPNALVAFEIAPVAGELGRFKQTFDDSVFPEGIGGLLGRILRIQVEDASEGVAFSEPVGLVRVIEQSPQTLSPQGNVTITDPTPTLVWSPVGLAYDFTYWADVYFRDGGGGSTLIERVEDISRSQTSYTLGQALAAGSYWWAVWIVDANGNRSRSRQASFNVQ